MTTFMKTTRLPILIAWSMLAISPALRAEDADSSSTEKETVSPSPNGRYAFVENFSPDQRTVDLVTAPGGRKLREVASSGDQGNRLSTSILWAPDSRRFAISIATDRLSAEVVVYRRDKGRFVVIALPKIPEAKIPDKLLEDPHTWHWQSIDYQKAAKWRKDRTLAVTVLTSRDGNDSVIDATRTVILKLDPHRPRGEDRQLHPKGEETLRVTP